MKTKAFLLLSCIISLSASHARGTPKASVEELSIFEETPAASATSEHKGYSLNQTHYATISNGEKTTTVCLNMKERASLLRESIFAAFQPKMTVDQKIYLVSNDNAIAISDLQTIEEMLLAHFGNTPVSGTYTLSIE